MEDKPCSPARINPLIAQQTFSQLHGANECKLLVGLHYLASQIKDIKEGPDQNIFNLAPGTNYGPWDHRPQWKRIDVTNWNDELREIGFDTANAQKLKNTLTDKFTRININPFTMKFRGEEYEHSFRGISLIVFEKKTHRKSGDVRFYIYVGGYTPILKNWWQAISPAFLHYEGIINTPTWKFIIHLGGTIRFEYSLIKNYLKKHGGLNHWPFVMNLDHVEKKMGIAEQNAAYKGQAWKEVYTLLGVEGVRLAEMQYFPLKRGITYGIEGFFQEQKKLWQQITGIAHQCRRFDDKQKKWRFQRDALMRKTQGRPDLIGFLLTKKMLREWLPIPRLREGNEGALPVKD